ncbi:MAG: winged helix-turn-helix transcriptional regulator [Clostridia bacterium]|nr:winged helix-turn-helix transcriptional regulator [Clostridia bacterium]
MFVKDLHISYLLDFYGEILSPKRRKVMLLYYNEDLSLGEIAQELGIARQGIWEQIKKAEEELLTYEEKLGLAGRFERLREDARKLHDLLEDEPLSEKARAGVRAYLDEVEEIL